MNGAGGEPGRIAYRLAYDEGIRTRTETNDRLEAYRTRVTQVFLADLVGAGAAMSGLTRLDTDKVQVPYPWLYVVVAGVAVTFAAFVWMTWGLQGRFRQEPLMMVHHYGDNPRMYQTDDAVLKDLALWLGRRNATLHRKVQRRGWSIYLSMIGVLVTVVGLIGLYASVL